MRDIFPLHTEPRPGRVTLAALLAVLLLGSCASPYYLLRSDTTVPELQEMLEKTNATEMHEQMVPVDLGHGHRACMVCQERGQTNATRMLVLISGIASDGSMWRYQVGELMEQGWLVCVMNDIGCGKSDAPDPRKLGPEAYSPPWLSRCILQALRTHLEDAPPQQRITLVGHSLGGMLILRRLSDPQLRNEFDDVLQRVDGAVLFTPIDVAVEKDQPLFKMLRELTDLDIALADALGILRSQVARGIAESVVDPAMATREEADRVLAILRDPRRRRAMQAMIMRAVPHNSGRPDWQKIEDLERSYANIRQPSLIVWGGRDELFSKSMGHELAHEVPNARLRIVRQGMHCLPTEHPRLCTSLIKQFVDDPTALASPQIATIDTAAVAGADVGDVIPVELPIEMSP